MNTKQAKFKPHRAYAKHCQNGITIIEVMIAIFVLAVGVLAVLSSQLRSIQSIEEAGDQTQVANIVQNLIESMQLNPLVEFGDTPTKKYADDSCSGNTCSKPDAVNYIRTAPNGAVRPKNCTQSSLCKYFGWTFTSGNPSHQPNTRIANLCLHTAFPNLTKKQLQEEHIGCFEDALVNALPAGAIIGYSICRSQDNNIEATGTLSPGNDTISNVDSHCSNDPNDQLFVKVIWQSRVQGTTPIIYTYTARVPTY